MSSLPSFDNPKDYMEKPSPGKRRPLALFLKILIVVFLLILVGEIVYFVFISERMNVREIHVLMPESLGLNKREIVAISGITSSTSVMNLDKEEILGRLIAHPEIRDASLRSQFPDKVFIEVFGREPVAAMISGDIAKVFCVDSDGSLFLSGNIDQGLPIISGIGDTSLNAGDALHESLFPMLEGLKKLQEQSPVIYNLISEVQLRRIGEAEFEGWIFFNHSKVRVRTDLRFSKEILENILLMVDLIDKQGITAQIDELDFRAGYVVLKMREE